MWRSGRGETYGPRLADTPLDRSDTELSAVAAVVAAAAVAAAVVVAAVWWRLESFSGVEIHISWANCREAI